MSCRIHLLATLLILGAAKLHAAPQATLHVAPDGNDANPGTVAKPLASLKGARDKVRVILAKGALTGDIEVRFREGDYLVEEPVEFGVQDSGKDGHRVVYRNADAIGSARFMGGQPIKGWVKREGAIWKKTGIDRPVGTIYENGKRAWRAREPNYKPDPKYPHARAPYLLTESGSLKHAIYRPGDLDPTGWTITKQARFAWWAIDGHRDWGRSENTRLMSVDPQTRTLALPGRGNPRFATVGKGDRYFIAAVFELLDAPGEFFHDPDAKTLYYMPMDGDPNAQDIRVPKPFGVISVAGESPTEHAHDIVFSGLMFEYVTFGGNFRKNGAIYLENVNCVTIDRCRFRNLGFYAVCGQQQVRDSVIRDCWIEHTAVGAIFLRSKLKRSEFPEGGNVRNLITNCKVHDIGEARVLAMQNGIMLWPATDCEVSHCEIFNAPRYAVSLRGHYNPGTMVGLENVNHMSRNTVFQYLKIHRVGTDSGDMGAVHGALLNEPKGNCINTWRQILVEGIHAHPSMKDIRPDGIFMDHPHSAEHQVFENFEIRAVQGKPYRGNQNPEQTWRNVSWKPGFDKSKMEYSRIGLTAEFPKEYGGKGLVDTTAPTPATPMWEQAPYAISATEIAMQAAPAQDDMSRVEYRFECLTEGGHSSHWQIKPVYVDRGLQPETRCTYRLRVRDTSRARNQTDGSIEAAATTLTADQDPCRAWFEFENNGQDTQQRHHGRFTGHAAFAAKAAQGKAALQLAGRHGYLVVPDHDELDIGAGDFAVSLWFTREKDEKDNLRLLSKYDGEWRGYALWGGNESIRFDIGAGKGSIRVGVSGRIPQLGEWVHLTVNVEHGKKITMYVNGKLAGEQPLSTLGGANLGNTTALTIGSDSHLTWRGMIDDVRIYKRLISEKEVATLAGTL